MIVCPPRTVLNGAAVLCLGLLGDVGYGLIDRRILCLPFDDNLAMGLQKARSSAVVQFGPPDGGSRGSK